MEKPGLIWLQGLTCNGNTHALYSAEPDLFDRFVSRFDLLYHPQIPAPFSLEEALDHKPDILVFEGAYGPDPRFLTHREQPLSKLLTPLLETVRYAVAAGSCASFGGIHREFESHKGISGLQFTGTEPGGFRPSRFRTKGGLPVVNVPGCPVHPQWLISTLLSLADGKPPRLDRWNRPVELFSRTVHHGCTRNEYFEWKVESKSFGLKEGCLFYDQGCRGPFTHGECNSILWNGVSSKPRSGAPCLGCTAFDFPQKGLFETKKYMGMPDQPPLDVPKRAYISITGVAKTFHIPRLERGLYDQDDS